jgi:hypothetical protein
MFTSNINANAKDIRDVNTMTAGSTISLEGGTGRILGTNVVATGAVSGAAGNFGSLGSTSSDIPVMLTSNINANAKDIRGAGTITAGSTISLEGGTGRILGTNVVATGAVSGAAGNFTTLGQTQLTGSIDANDKTPALWRRLASRAGRVFDQPAPNPLYRVNVDRCVKAAHPLAQQ